MRQINYNEIPEGSEDFPMSVDLRGFEPPTGGSGHVTPGNYKLQIARLRLEKKKTGTGMNFHLEAKVVEPVEFAGPPIHSYIPAPTVYNTDDFGYTQERSLLWAVLNDAGKLEDAQKSDSVDLTAGKLKGVKFNARLGDGKGEYASRSQINNFISAQEFKASPGPDRTLPQITLQEPQQGTPPEMLPAAGNSKSAGLFA